MRLIDFFDRSAALTPNAAFVKQGDVSRSYAQSQAATHCIAAALIRDGFGPGTRVGVYMPNDWRGLEAMFGFWRAGCVMVPVNARNAVAQNAQILADAGAEVVFYHSSFARELDKVRAACPKVTLTICIDDGMADWMAPEGTQAPHIAQAPDDLWTLYATSGTTGKSKGVRHTHLSNMVACMDMLHALQVHGAVNHLVVAPMTHFAGSFIFALTVTGGTHILLDSVEPEAILAAIEAERAQILFLPPTIIYRMLSSPDLGRHDYSSLHRFAYGAAPMAPQKLREAMDVFGPVMTNFFGQAEGIGPICFLSPEDHRPDAGGVWEDRLMSIGKPSILRQVAIVDDDGQPQPPGTRGEVAVRSWGVTQGYENNPQATAEAFKNGWYLTGDIGVADAEGYVTLVDRKKDMIVSGGFNIYPAEVERELLSHPDVQEAAVIGVPDPDWGEAVKAVVELRAGGAVSEAELIALCKDRLGSMRAPKSVEFRDELPRNATGKVLKREIRAPFWEGYERAI
ncbi:AMP-binding protein [Lutimaribacter saemankumensis]|uniref:3-methylmercaptopropionyl-CoA ligase n=1 Tax=Lutimaribacter saemankumensis TaxID=490829 RepID=A0A1G8SGB0_9RHOB|nr:AMP-binding protein [Lutimaribacter saemankumensis]SDJ27795.1 Acyl-CoA synthetase (AMP-forming)/AMP-acid ligase II [Lutimaribacter saemankumensis]